MKQTENNKISEKIVKKTIGKIFDGFWKEIGRSLAVGLGTFFAVYFGGKEVTKPFVEELSRSDTTIIISGEDTTSIVSRPFFVINNNKNLVAAEKKELAGFQALVDKDFNMALSCFRDSENSANGYHASYEIARYLRNNRKSVSNPDFWGNTYKYVIKDFRGYIPTDVLEEMEEFIKSQN